MKCMTIVFLLAVFMSSINWVDSHCCRFLTRRERIIRPGEHCYATRPCNIFCCNCDGPCRCRSYGFFVDGKTYPQSQLESRLQSQLDAKQQFSKLDRDNNGRIDLQETALYLGKDNEQVSNLFHKLDKDASGFIEPREFDNSLI